MDRPRPAAASPREGRSGGARSGGRDHARGRKVPPLTDLVPRSLLEDLSLGSSSVDDGDGDDGEGRGGSRDGGGVGDQGRQLQFGLNGGDGGADDGGEDTIGSSHRIAVTTLRARTAALEVDDLLSPYGASRRRRRTRSVDNDDGSGIGGGRINGNPTGRGGGQHSNPSRGGGTGSFDDDIDALLSRFGSPTSRGGTSAFSPQRAPGADGDGDVILSNLVTSSDGQPPPDDNTASSSPESSRPSIGNVRPATRTPRKDDERGFTGGRANIAPAASNSTESSRIPPSSSSSYPARKTQRERTTFHMVGLKTDPFANALVHTVSGGLSDAGGPTDPTTDSIVDADISTCTSRHSTERVVYEMEVDLRSQTSDSDRLEKQLAESQRENAKLYSDYLSVRKQVDGLKMRLDGRDDEIGRLNAELEAVRESADAALEREREREVERWEAVRQEAERVRSELRSYVGRCKVLDGELSDARGLNDALRRERDDAVAQLEQRDDDAVARVQIELATATELNADLRTENERLRAAAEDAELARQRQAVDIIRRVEHEKEVEMERESDGLRGEVRQLREELDESREVTASLRTENEALSSEARVLRKEGQSDREKLERCHASERGQLQQTIEELEGQAIRSSDEIRALTGIVEMSRSGREEIQRDSAQVKEELQSLQQQCEDLTDELSIVKAAHTALQHEKADLEDLLKGKDENIEKVECELYASTEACVKLEQEKECLVDGSNDEALIHKEEAARLETELFTVQDTARELESKLAEIKTERQEMQNKIQQLNEELSESNGLASDLRTENERLASEALAEHAEMSRRLATKEAESQHLSTKVGEEASAAIKELISELEVAKIEQESSRLQVSESFAKLAELDQALQGKVEDVSALQQSLKDAEKERDSSREEIKKQRKQRINVVSEMKTVIETLEEAKEEARKSNVRIITLEQEIEALKASLSETKQSAEHTQASARQQVDESLANLADLEESLQGKDGEVLILQQSLNDAEKERDVCRKEKEEQRAQYDAAGRMNRERLETLEKEIDIKEDESQAAVTKLVLELGKAESKLEALERAQEEADAANLRVLSLGQQVAALKASLSEAKQSAEHAQASARHQVDESLANLAVLEKALQGKDTEVIALQQSLTDAEKERDACLKEKEEQRAQYDSASRVNKERLETLEKEIDIKEDESKTAVTELVLELGKAESKLESLEEARKEADAANLRIASLEQQVEALKASLSEQDQEMADLPMKLQSKAEEVMALQNILKEGEKAKYACQHELEEERTQHNTLSSEMTARIESLEKQCHAKEDECKAAVAELVSELDRAEFEKLESLEQAKQEFGEANAKIASLELEVSALEASLSEVKDSAKDEQESARQQVNESHARLAELEQTQREKHSEVLALQQSLQDAEKERDAFGHELEIQKLKSDNESKEMTLRIEALEKEVDIKEDERRAAVAGLISESKKSESKFKSLEHAWEANVAKSRIVSLEQEVAALEANLSEAKQDTESAQQISSESLAKLAELEQALHGKAEEVMALQQNLKDTEKERDACQHETEEQRRHYDSTSSEMKARIESFEKQEDESKACVAELVFELEKVEAEKLESLAKANEEVYAANLQCSSLELEVAGQKESAKDTADYSRESAQLQMSESHTKLAELEEVVCETSVEMLALKRNLKDAETERDDCRNEIEEQQLQHNIARNEMTARMDSMEQQICIKEEECRAAVAELVWATEKAESEKLICLAQAKEEVDKASSRIASLELETVALKASLFEAKSVSLQQDADESMDSTQSRREETDINKMTMRIEYVEKQIVLTEKECKPAIGERASKLDTAEGSEKLEILERAALDAANSRVASLEVEVAALKASLLEAKSICLQHELDESIDPSLTDETKRVIKEIVVELDAAQQQVVHQSRPPERWMIRADKMVASMAFYRKVCDGEKRLEEERIKSKSQLAHTEASYKKEMDSFVSDIDSLNMALNASKVKAKRLRSEKSEAEAKLHQYEREIKKMQLAGLKHQHTKRLREESEASYVQAEVEDSLFDSLLSSHEALASDYDEAQSAIISLKKVLVLQQSQKDKKHCNIADKTVQQSARDETLGDNSVESDLSQTEGFPPEAAALNDMDSSAACVEEAGAEGNGHMAQNINLLRYLRKIVNDESVDFDTMSLTLDFLGRLGSNDPSAESTQDDSGIASDHESANDLTWSFDLSLPTVIENDEASSTQSKDDEASKEVEECNKESLQNIDQLDREIVGADANSVNDDEVLDFSNAAIEIEGKFGVVLDGSAQQGCSLEWDSPPRDIFNDLEMVQFLRQRCERLESEREDLLNETIDLLESSRAECVAETEAAVAKVKTQGILEVAKCQQESREQMTQLSLQMTERYEKLKSHWITNSTMS